MEAGACSSSTGYPRDEKNKKRFDGMNNERQKLILLQSSTLRTKRAIPTSLQLSARRSASTIDILLLKDVVNRGIRGEVVNVRAGYFRNLLYPRKLAVYATQQNLEKYSYVINEAEIRKVAGMKATPLEFTISESKPVVTANDIKKILHSLYSIDPSKYELKLDAPLKDVGEYMVNIHGEEVRVVLTAPPLEPQQPDQRESQPQ